MAEIIIPNTVPAQKIFAETIGQKLNKTPIFTNFVNDDAGNGYKQYYSQIDAKIYFGGQYVEDIAGINCSIVQNVMPITGYNSHIPDEIVQGSRYITGSFTINFTSPNYLHELVKVAKLVSLEEAKKKALSENTGATLSKDFYINKETSKETDFDNHNFIFEGYFDIDIVLGKDTTFGGKARHYILESVKLGHAQIISPYANTGQPMQEMYQFVGKDIRAIN